MPTALKLKRELPCVGQNLKAFTEGLFQEEKEKTSIEDEESDEEMAQTGDGANEKSTQTEKTRLERIFEGIGKGAEIIKAQFQKGLDIIKPPLKRGKYSLEKARKERAPREEPKG